MLILALLLVPIVCQAIDEDGWETLQVVPHVSGLRVESLVSEKGFLGYTEAWELIVEPEAEVTVVVFGYWLDKVEYVTFTDQVCLTSEFNISSSNFFVHTESRIEFKFKFPDWSDPWRLCVKQKGKYGELLLIDDDRTWITTAAVRKEHYMPIPLQIVILTVLFFMSALFSGLNLGLMSLSTQELNLIIKSGSAKDAKNATAILPVRKRGNYLLCTILIMNVVVNASISILFEDLTSGAVAFITSSLGIVILGEIVPQSACVKHGLAVGAKTLFLTRFFMFVTYPLSMPISKVLDLLLGEDVDQFDRNRLVEIMKMTTDGEEKDLADAMVIAVGAMEISKKVAVDVMTRIDDVYMLSEDEVLDATTIADIVKRGYTRIPIYTNNDRNQISSLLFVKDLALVDKKNNIPIKAVSQYHDRQLRIVDEDTPLSELLEEFKRGSYHLAMIKKSTRRESNVDGAVDFLKNSSSQPLLVPHKDERKSQESESEAQQTQLMGLVTLEDIIEEILQSEIIDESDSVLDNVQRSKRKLSQSKIAELFCCETRSEALSLNMLGVVDRFLRERSPVFDTFMDEKAREKMIQKNIRQAILVSRRIDGTNRSVKLYEMGVASKRVILILEGKCKVTFKSGMSFDIGPWTFFGDVLLNRIISSVGSEQHLHSGMVFKPDFDLLVDHPCRFLQITVSTLLHTLRISQLVRHLRTPTISVSDVSTEEDGIPLLMCRKGRRSPMRARNSSLLFCPSSEELSDETRVRSISAISPPNIRIQRIDNNSS